MLHAHFEAVVLSVLFLQLVVPLHFVVLLLHHLPVLRYGHVLSHDGIRHVHLQKHILFLLVLIGQLVDELVGSFLGLRPGEQIPVHVVPILDADIVALVGRVLGIVLEHVLVLLALPMGLESNNRPLNTCYGC